MRREQTIHRETFLLALHVLTRFIDNKLNPTSRDLNILRREVLPKEAGLPIDELCWLIIHRILVERQALRRCRHVN